MAPHPRDSLSDAWMKPRGAAGVLVPPRSQMLGHDRIEAHDGTDAEDREYKKEG